MAFQDRVSQAPAKSCSHVILPVNTTDRTASKVQSQRYQPDQKRGPSERRTTLCRRRCGLTYCDRPVRLAVEVDPVPQGVEWRRAGYDSPCISASPQRPLDQFEPVETPYGGERERMMAIFFSGQLTTNLKP